jgi:hypothetical protein
VPRRYADHVAAGISHLEMLYEQRVGGKLHGQSHSPDANSAGLPMRGSDSIGG